MKIVEVESALPMAHGLLSPAEVTRFGDCELDLSSGELRRNGQVTRLQPQQVALLTALMSKDGQVVPRAELQKALWPEQSFGEFEDGLNHAVIRLRTALGDSAQRPRYIETVPRRGYRFVATVESAPSFTDSAPSAVVERRRTPKWLRTGVLASVGAVLLLGASVSIVSFRRGNEPPITSIAVLPLKNLTGEPGQEYLAEAVTEEITTELARVEGLTVVSRTTASKYKASTQSIPQIGRELGVDAAVEGGVQRVGDQLRITVQIIRTRNDRHIWADTYEGSMRDVLGLEARATHDIAEQIRRNASFRVTSPPQPVVPEAYEAYRRGLQSVRTWNQTNLREAAEYFQQSVERDPNFAPAWAELGHAHGMLGFISGNSPDAHTALFRSATEKALQLDPKLAAAHVNLGDIKFYGDWDWAAGEAEFRRAVELDPTSVEAQEHYAVSLWLLRRFDAAEQEMKRALRLDPTSPRINTELGHLLRHRHDYDGALRHYKRALELQPGYANAIQATASVYERLGKHDEAIAEYLRALALQGAKPEMIKSLSDSYARNGTAGFWTKRLEVLQARSPKRDIPPITLASLYARNGKDRAAILSLNEGYRRHIPMLVWINGDEEWERLRGNAQFQEILRKMNLPRE